LGATEKTKSNIKNWIIHKFLNHFPANIVEK